MVSVDSHRVPRVPWYSSADKEPSPFAYGSFTLCGGPFQRPSARIRFVTPSPRLSLALSDLRHPASIGPRATELAGFRLFPVRSPLLGEYFLFLGVLRCFTSPACLHPAYVFGWRYPGFTWMGCPIRKSTARSLLGSSPWLFAVLLRPSSALDAKAFTVRLMRLTCFRLDVRLRLGLVQFVVCFPHYSIVKVLLHTKKRLGDFSPNRQGLSITLIALYVFVLDMLCYITIRDRECQVVSQDFCWPFQVTQKSNSQSE